MISSGTGCVKKSQKLIKGGVNNCWYGVGTILNVPSAKRKQVLLSTLKAKRVAGKKYCASCENFMKIHPKKSPIAMKSKSRGN